MLEPPSASSQAIDSIDSAEPIDAVDAESSESKSFESLANVPPATDRQPLILVVEDSHDNQALMQLILEEMGYAFAIARDGTTALAWLAEYTPNLILLDLSLPEIDGWQIASTLKADPKTAKIPILATTAHAMQGDREAAIAAGCDDYLPKPLDIEKLEESVNYWLGKTD
jgi:two-component system cell cycle response regulator DivK